DDAREYVGDLAAELGVSNFKTKLACGKDLTIPTSGGPRIVNLRKEVFQARLTGFAPNMQGLIDSSDPLMPSPISLGASMRGTVKITSTIRGHTTSLDGDGILEPPVGALADDVLFYRRQAVEASTGHNLAEIARAYRTYLQVCISLVDAFLGYATFSLERADPSKTASEDFKIVQSTAPFETRVDAWSKLFDHPPETFRRTRSWSDLSKLRRERNRYVHPAEPIYLLGVDEVVNVLNQCREGVGGTLEYFRRIAGLHPLLSYIQKVKTAPIITKSKR
ncbi:MAG: hypothetical protein WAN05_01010, partial [Roseiarcus sp.]